jgi:Predicted membrane protein (DUF2232)
MEPKVTAAPEPASPGWPRALALLGCVLVLSTPVVHASVLIAAPLLLLLAVRGLRGIPVLLAMILSTLILATGVRDGVWYAERAWSVLIGGGFLGLTMVVPGWRVASRAMGAVFGSLAVATGVLSVRRDAWGALDAAIGNGVRSVADTSLDAMTGLSSGGGLSPTLVTALHQTAEAQAVVYPALIALASLAALGVVWWARTRLTGGGDQALAPLRDFRFNDHLVWLLVAGLLLLLSQWGDALVRVGSNAVVFMGVLYALRGAAVFVFMSGGLSMFGCLTFAVGFVLAAPVVLAVAVLIGIGDTWLDLRARAAEKVA